jgi:hypothetical protein
LGNAVQILALSNVAGGWMDSGTFFFRTGLPFSVYDGNMPGRLSGSSLAAFLVSPIAPVPVTCGAAARNTYSANPTPLPLPERVPWYDH